MIKAIVRIDDLEIEVYQEGNLIGIHADGENVIFPKARTQDVIDAILSVDWSIRRQHDSAAAHKSMEK